MQSKTGTTLFQVGLETQTLADRLDKSPLALEQCVGCVPRHCPKPALATASAPWYITDIPPLCEDTRHAPHPRPPLLRLRRPDPSRTAHRGHLGVARARPGALQRGVARRSRKGRHPHRPVRWTL